MKGNFIKIGDKTFGIEGSLNMEYNNPLFDRDNLRAFGSTPFTKQADEELLQALGNPHLLQNKKREIEINDVDLYSDGQRIFKGVLYLTDTITKLNTGGAKIQAVIGDGKNNLSSKWEGKTLKDLELCGPIVIENTDETYDPEFVTDPGTIINSPTTDWAEDVVNNGHPYFCFPTVRNVGMTYGSAITPNLINPWVSGVGMLRMDATKCNAAKVEFMGIANTAPYVLNTIAPMFYYRKVLEHCFSEFGFTLKGAFLDQIDDVILLNTHCIVKPRFILYDTVNELFEPITLFKRYDEMTTTITPANHMPELAIKDFVQDFLISFNCGLNIRGNEVHIIQYTGKSSNTDLLPIAHPEPITDYKDPQNLNLRYEFDSVENHPNYDTLRDFKKELTSVPEYPTHTISATDGNGTLVNIQTLNKLAKVMDEATAPNEVCDNLVPYSTGEGTDNVALVFPASMTKLNYTLSPASGNEAYLPTLQRPANCETEQWIVYTGVSGSIYELSNITLFFGLVEIETCATKAFYHGLRNTFSAYEYPYASNHNYAPDSTTKLRDWHLGWLGDEGLFETFWAPSRQVFDAKMGLRWIMHPKLQDILNWNWEGDILVRGVHYYTKAIRFTLPYSGNAEIELYEKPATI